MTVKIEEHFRLVNDVYSRFSVMSDSYSYCQIFWTSFSLKDCLKLKYIAIYCLLRRETT